MVTNKGQLQVGIPQTEEDVSLIWAQIFFFISCPSQLQSAPVAHFLNTGSPRFMTYNWMVSTVIKTMLDRYPTLWQLLFFCCHWWMEEESLYSQPASGKQSQWGKARLA